MARPLLATSAAPADAHTEPDAHPEPDANVEPDTEPDIEPDAHAERSLPPRTPYEDALVDILGDVLGRTGIDVHDGLLTLSDVSQVPRAVAQIQRTLGVDVTVLDYVESRTVAGLAARVAAVSSAARSASRPRALRPRPPGARPVLSYDQQRLWMENQLLPGVVYNVHGRRRVVGRLDADVLEASMRAIIARHETLRTRFPAGDDDPVQVVDEPDDGRCIRLEDLTARPVADVAQEARRLLDEELTTPFDLETGPLIRCVLIRLGEEEHALGVTMHHIVSDAWSIGLIIRELTTLYEAGGDPVRAGLAPLPVQYRDYAVWQRRWLTGEALERRLDHWRRHLSDAPRAIAMPTVQRRTGALRAEAGQVTAELSTGETAALHRLSREHGVTSFMVHFAVLATIFARWSGQTDVVIGVPVAGRTSSATDRLIGFFVNMLPLRVDLSGDPTFAELLERVRRTALDGYAHAEAPMDELVRDLDIARDPRRTPLFEVVLNVVASPEAEDVTGLAIEPLETPSLFSRYDLTFTAQESGGVLRFKLDFPADRCDPPTGTALLEQLRTLLGAATADPSVHLLDVPVPVPVPAGGPPAPRPAPHASAARHAGSGLVAVVDGDGEHGYGWLARAAGAVAGALAGRGLGPADRVGLVRRPTAGFVAALVGAAQAGVTCTVVETDDPTLTAALELAAVLDVRPASEPAAGTTDLSGLVSPDGAPGAPAGPVDAGPADWAVARYGFGPGDRFVVLSSRPGHLLSAVCTALDAGAVLVVPDRGFGDDVDALTGWLRENAVTVAYLDPPLLRALTARTPVPVLPDLSCVVVGNAGDLLPHDVEAARELAPGCRFVAVHRMTADGRPLAAHEAPADTAVRDAPLRVPLGLPLPGMGVSLRRPSGQPAGVGELAEIRHGDERTGDLGRLRPDGVLEYAGEAGVPPGRDLLDTVSVLRDVPGVRDALVVEQPGPDGTTTLTAYLAGPDPALSTEAVHSRVRTRLPDYLVPDRLVVLPALPRTPWGEYDLRALPRPTGDGAPDDHTAPRTPMEQRLTSIIEELLALPRVGVHDSFFELGGFSMLATRLLSRVRDAFGVQLAVRDVFESPTVDELARLIVRTQGEQAGRDDFEALLSEIEQAGP